MSGVFKNIDPPPPHRPASVSSPRPWCGGRTHSLGREWGGGSIFWKTPVTALYSTYASTLCSSHSATSHPHSATSHPRSATSRPILMASTRTLNLNTVRD